jgi:chromosome segregation ATPase
MKATEEEMQNQLQQLSDENSTLAGSLNACTLARVEMQQRIEDLEQQLGHLDTVQNRCNELEERLHQTQQSLATTQQENQDLKTAAEDANTKQQVVGLFS